MSHQSQRDRQLVSTRQTVGFNKTDGWFQRGKLLVSTRETAGFNEGNHRFRLEKLPVPIGCQAYNYLPCTVTLPFKPT